MDICHESGCLAIQGARDGRQFRPSDWEACLAAGAGGFGSDGRLRHAPWVNPPPSQG